MEDQNNNYAPEPGIVFVTERPKHRGLPISNLTSQFFANVYLNALDQFVKRTLGVRGYVRYVDDFVLLPTDAGVLRAWEERIRVFLAERLRLEAHPVHEIRPVSEGVDFVGYLVRPGYVLPRRRDRSRLHRSAPRPVEQLRGSPPSCRRASTPRPVAGEVPDPGACCDRGPGGSGGAQRHGEELDLHPRERVQQQLLPRRGSIR